jgi:hypothetical protein
MPTVASKAVSSGALGTVCSIGSVTGGTDTFTPMGSIMDFKPSGRKRNVIDVTTFDSLGVARKLGTVLEGGDITLSFQAVPNDPGQLAAYAAFVDGEAYDFKIQLPVNKKAGQTTTGNSYTFSAIVSQCEMPSVSVTKEDEFSMTLTLDGDYTTTQGS